MIEGHGNDRYNYGESIKIDFSSNIAFNNNSRLIIEHLHGKLEDIENYPDPTARVLCSKIAALHSISPSSLMVCNGSAEAFYLVAHHIAKSANFAARSLIFTPSFAEYEDSCKLFGHQLEYATLSDFEELNYSLFNSVWLGTPNNPDGSRISMERVEAIALLHPSCWFIVDRAYNDLSTSCDRESYRELPDNIILINSLTKSFGIPGLRLGYIIASKWQIESICKLSTPWSVNALSLAAGEFAMDNYDKLRIDISELLEESQHLQRELSKLSYLDVTPSDANFFLCKINDGREAQELHQHLIKQYGILIRNASNFRGLTPHHFRIAAQSRRENNILIDSLKRWI